MYCPLRIYQGDFPSPLPAAFSGKPPDVKLEDIYEEVFTLAATDGLVAGRFDAEYDKA